MNWSIDSLRIKTLVFLLFTLFLGWNISSAFGATLELSPSSGTFRKGKTVNINILLNTQGAAIDGVDIHYLNYNPTMVRIEDADPVTPGVQITRGSLMPLTLANSVDSTKGQIIFSQLSPGGSQFANTTPQVLASFKMTILKRGPIDILFNFTLGSTSDSNVAAFNGTDLLSNVIDGHFRANPLDITSDAIGLEGGQTLVLLAVVIVILITLSLIWGRRAYSHTTRRK